MHCRSWISSSLSLGRLPTAGTSLVLDFECSRRPWRLRLGMPIPSMAGLKRRRKTQSGLHADSRRLQTGHPRFYSGEFGAGHGFTESPRFATFMELWEVARFLNLCQNEEDQYQVLSGKHLVVHLHGEFPAHLLHLRDPVIMISLWFMAKIVGATVNGSLLHSIHWEQDSKAKLWIFSLIRPAFEEPWWRQIQRRLFFFAALEIRTSDIRHMQICKGTVRLQIRLHLVGYIRHGTPRSHRVQVMGRKFVLRLCLVTYGCFTGCDPVLTLLGLFAGHFSTSFFTKLATSTHQMLEWTWRVIVAKCCKWVRYLICRWLSYLKAIVTCLEKIRVLSPPWSYMLSIDLNCTVHALLAVQ